MALYQAAMGWQSEPTEPYYPVVDLIEAKSQEDALLRLVSCYSTGVQIRPWGALPLVKRWDEDTPIEVQAFFNQDWLFEATNTPMGPMKCLTYPGYILLGAWLFEGLPGLYYASQALREPVDSPFSRNRHKLQPFRARLTTVDYQPKPVGPEQIWEGPGLYVVNRLFKEHEELGRTFWGIFAIWGQDLDLAEAAISWVGQGRFNEHYSQGPALAPLQSNTLPAELQTVLSEIQKLFVELKRVEDHTYDPVGSDIGWLRTWLTRGVAGLFALVNSPEVKARFPDPVMHEAWVTNLRSLLLKADAEGQYLWGLPYVPPRDRFKSLERAQAASFN